ncbi:MAG: radical SAM protein [Deltaproteobacteria bacterium]|nr:radical SAM protein [Deltaproteobacteria bacterium]
MISRLLGIRVFEVEVSSRCNVRCQFCPRHLMQDPGLMSQKTFSKLLNVFPFSDRTSLALVGMGEPLLNPLLPDFISQTKKQHSGLHVWVTTNGTLLDEEITARLLNSGLDTLDVSFNGTEPSSYEGLMKGANFEATLANIDRALEMKERSRSKVRLQVNFILTQENASSERDIKSFWRSRGIRHFRVQHMHNRGGRAHTRSMTGRNGAGLQGNKCMMFEVMPFVTWQGDVLYCSHDILREHKLGNVGTESWETIERRRKAVVDQMKWPSMCQSCTDPQRHNIRKQIDKDVRTELLRRITGAFWGAL